ncbi:MAG: hypothetical protein M1838_000829 [Thelocarpon superellum]|nr:MAG: hypothetical protein M1838_000829 [Thelocarpon superellum]
MYTSPDSAVSPHSGIENGFDEEVDTAKEAIPELPSVLLDCTKFRILIVGQSGVGESTICSQVFNVSGKCAGNENIILHDSGGFEAGDQDALEEIQTFIRHRRGQPRLADQLHCIWYCISCDSPRPFQIAEESFFKDVETGDVPVVAIFTQFDLLVDKHFNTWRREWKNSHPYDRHLPDEEGERMARWAALEDYNQNYRDELLRRIGLHSSVGIRRVKIPPALADRAHITTCRSADPTGVEDLVIRTVNGLTGNNHRILRVLWAAAQRFSADLKVEQSLAQGMSTFWGVVGSNAIPLTPLVGATMTYRAFGSIVTNLSAAWGIPDPHRILCESSARNVILEGFFDKSIWKAKGAFGAWTVLSLVTLNIYGPLLVVPTAVLLLKIIAGVTLIFERLFLEQMVDGGSLPLSTDLIRTVVTKFRHSTGQKLMAGYINGSVDLANTYKKQKIWNVLEQATTLARTQTASEYSKKGEAQ